MFPEDIESVEGIGAFQSCTAEKLGKAEGVSGRERGCGRSNGKVDMGQLPAHCRTHLSSPGLERLSRRQNGAAIELSADFSGLVHSICGVGECGESWG